MKKYYEAYDERYRIIHDMGHSWSGSIPTPAVMETINKYSIAPGSAILEIGCGEGRDAFCLLNQGYGLLATDISEEAVNYCRGQDNRFADHFSVLDCINDLHQNTYDFIYSIAVIHMLVDNSDRKAFYKFIREHLNDDGLALICSMGDGLTEAESDISEAFDMVERNHENGTVLVPATSLKMISFNTFEKEMTDSKLKIIENGITSSLPEFNSLMYAIVKKVTKR